MIYELISLINTRIVIDSFDHFHR